MVENVPVIVSGKTFELRDRLKLLGGRWNGDVKGWEFYTLSQQERRELSAHVGVIVSDRSGDVGPVYQSSPRYTPLTTQIRREPRSDDNDNLLRRLVERIDNEPTRQNVGLPNMFGDDHSWFNYFFDQNPMTFFGFSSLPAMTKYLEALSEDDRNGNGWTSRNLDWNGSECMADAIDIARDGWPDGVELAQEVHEKLIGKHARQRRRKHSVSGGAVNIGRLLAGNPDHMLSRPKQRGKKVVTFFVESFMSAGIDADNAVIRAALIGAIADILEINGYSCEIVSIATARTAQPKPAYQIATTLKAAGETLNLNDVVFGLGHPAYFRRLCFGCVGSDPHLRSVWGSMGYPAKAFNTAHPPQPNEFFIDKINLIDQRKIDDDAPLISKAMQIWDLITDGNLPVTLNREEIDA